jgi:hypothetical protein
MWIKQIAFILFCFASASFSQTRTWGFSKDSVFGWNPSGDSVALVNQSMDTLKFDSVAVELVKPSSGYFILDFFGQDLNPNIGIGYRANFSSWYSQASWFSYSPKRMVGLPQQVTWLWWFRINENLPILVKRSQTSWTGDTLKARLIFIASAGRGRDSVLITAMWSTTSIRHSGIGTFENASAEQWFDVKGRRVEVSPVLNRAPRIPLRVRKE